MSISKKHYEFIKLVSEGATFEAAYATSCNETATNANARSQGSRLAKKYATEIAEANERLQKVITSVRDSEIVKTALNGILSQVEVDKKLSDIINGELIEITQMNAFGKAIKVKISPTISQIQSGIEAYYKRFGSNAPSKIEAKIESFVIPPLTEDQIKALNERIEKQY